MKTNSKIDLQNTPYKQAQSSHKTKHRHLRKKEHQCLTSPHGRIHRRREGCRRRGGIVWTAAAERSSGGRGAGESQGCASAACSLCRGPCPAAEAEEEILGRRRSRGGSGADRSPCRPSGPLALSPAGETAEVAEEEAVEGRLRRRREGICQLSEVPWLSSRDRENVIFFFFSEGISVSVCMVCLYIYLQL